MHRERHDVIIVGSGLGGLSTAACLAAAGRRVLVLEAAEIIGGCSQTFRRKGLYEFDCGVHYVGGCAPGCDGLIATILRGLGVEDRIAWSRLDDDGMDDVHFPDHHFRVPTSWEGLSANLREAYPADAAGLAACVDELRRIGQAVQRINDVPWSVKAVLPLGKRPWEVALLVRALEQPVAGLFARHGLGREAQDAILALVHLHNTPPARTPPLLLAALLQHYFRHGAYFPTRGGQDLAANLAEVIQSHGGEIRTRTRVRSIDVVAGRVTGVTLADGRPLAADVVVSNADVHRTYQDLIAPEHLRRQTSARVRRFRRPHSIFSTYVGADVDLTKTRPASNVVLHGRYGMQDTFDRLDSGRFDPEGWLAVSSPTLKTRGLGHYGPAGHSSIEAFMAVPADYGFWGGGDPMLGKDYASSPVYQERKAEIEGVVMDRMLEALPELRGHVTWLESATPMTHERYTLSRMPYGPENAKDQIGPWRRFSATTEIDGLFLAGASTVFLYGIAFTLRGGVGTASAILGRDLLKAFHAGEVLADVAALPDHGPDWDPFDVSRGHALKGRRLEEQLQAMA